MSNKPTDGRPQLPDADEPVSIGESSCITMVDSALMGLRWKLCRRRMMGYACRRFRCQNAGIAAPTPTHLPDDLPPPSDLAPGRCVASSTPSSLRKVLGVLGLLLLGALVLSQLSSALPATPTPTRTATVTKSYQTRLAQSSTYMRATEFANLHATSTMRSALTRKSMLLTLAPPLVATLAPSATATGLPIQSIRPSGDTTTLLTVTAFHAAQQEFCHAFG